MYTGVDDDALSGEQYGDSVNSNRNDSVYTGVDDDALSGEQYDDYVSRQGKSFVLSL